MKYKNWSEGARQTLQEPKTINESYWPRHFGVGLIPAVEPAQLTNRPNGENHFKQEGNYCLILYLKAVTDNEICRYNTYPTAFYRRGNSPPDLGFTWFRVCCGDRQGEAVLHSGISAPRTAGQREVCLPQVLGGFPAGEEPELTPCPSFMGPWGRRTLCMMAKATEGKAEPSTWRVCLEPSSSALVGDSLQAAK